VSEAFPARALHGRDESSFFFFFAWVFFFRLKTPSANPLRFFSFPECSSPEEVFCFLESHLVSAPLDRLPLPLCLAPPPFFFRTFVQLEFFFPFSSFVKGCGLFHPLPLTFLRPFPEDLTIPMACHVFSPPLFFFSIFSPPSNWWKASLSPEVAC